MSPTGKRTDPIYQAQAILAIRDHSVAEITLKLKRKGFEQTDIATALSWLEQNKLINDTQFAERYIESITNSKPVGPMWLKAKLRQKGIAPDIISITLAKQYSLDRERQLAKEATTAFTRRSHDPARLYRFLLARGFSSDVIKEQPQIVTEE